MLVEVGVPRDETAYLWIIVPRAHMYQPGIAVVSIPASRRKLSSSIQLARKSIKNSTLHMLQRGLRSEVFECGDGFLCAYWIESWIEAECFV